MQQPASLSVSAPPAPVIKHTSPLHLTYEEVRHAALTSVLDDLTRQLQYKKHITHLRATGGTIQVIPTSSNPTNTSILTFTSSNNNTITNNNNNNNSNSDTIYKASATRLLKEHSSAAWGVYFYQWSLFGLTGISSVAAVMGVYVTIYHSRMFLPLGPMAAAVAWRLWDLLEAAWEQQRYIDNAAQLREGRRGNPMHMVARQRTGNKEAKEPLEDIM